MFPLVPRPPSPVAATPVPATSPPVLVPLLCATVGGYAIAKGVKSLVGMSSEHVQAVALTLAGTAAVMASFAMAAKSVPAATDLELSVPGAWPAA